MFLERPNFEKRLCKKPDTFHECHWQAVANTSSQTTVINKLYL